MPHRELVGQPVGFRQLGAFFNRLAYGVQEQVEVGWIMHIGFNHKGVAAGTKRPGRGDMMFKLLRLNLGCPIFWGVYFTSP